MPVYEYRCNKCRRRLSIFVRSFSASAAAPVCEACGGADVTRLISRFTFQTVDRPAFQGGEDDEGFEMHDAEHMANWAKEMTEKVDEDVAPEFERVAKGLETGQFEVRPHQEEPFDVM
ncbi:MAG: zinc ribbon domain-containing protein [Chloroflexi bacterium]|nr:zinc ribbon domain-containing protein [Chloroflexota bacterium]